MKKKDKGFRKGKLHVETPSETIKRVGTIQLEYETAEELRKAAWWRPDNNKMNPGE